MKRFTIFIFVMALFVGVFSQTGFAREVMVKPVNNGGVIDGLPQTIIADSTARKAALPELTTYILEAGGIYPMVTEVINKGYFLHIKSNNPKGDKPILVPSPRADGGFNIFFTLRSNAKFENLNITAMRTPPPSFSATRHNIGIYDGATLKAYGCEIAYDVPGAAFNLWSNNCSIFLEDCFVHSTGHYRSLGGNGRLVSVRASVDTVSIVNCTGFDHTDRVLRVQGVGEVKVTILDHNTFLNGAGWHGGIELGKSHKAIVTNNVFYNLILFGSHKNRVNGGKEDEQEHPEGDKMYVITLDTVFVDCKMIIANNNVFWDQQYKDLWATYSAITSAPGVITPTLLRVNTAPGSAVFEEALKFVAPPPSIYDYIAAGLADPNATIFPENFYFGPASGINLSYGTSAASYTAAAGGFPIGDLNYYPDKKAAWVAAGKPIVTAVAEHLQNTPSEFKLAQNYPNPFNPSTRIDFVLPKNTHVKLSVYNMLGQRMKTLIDQTLSAGAHQATWNGTNESGETVANGIYVYSLHSEMGVQTKKMMLMK
jgi:hypothetical protein